MDINKLSQEIYNKIKNVVQNAFDAVDITGTVSLEDSLGNLIDDTNPLPTERPEISVIPTKTTVSVSGSVTAGKYAVTFITSDDFVGTILGDSTGVSEVITFSTDYNAVLEALAYTITAGSLTILTIE